MHFRPKTYLSAALLAVFIWVGLFGSNRTEAAPLDVPPANNFSLKYFWGINDALKNTNTEGLASIGDFFNFLVKDVGSKFGGSANPDTAKTQPIDTNPFPSKEEPFTPPEILTPKEAAGLVSKAIKDPAEADSLKKKAKTTGLAIVAKTTESRWIAKFRG